MSKKRYSSIRQINWARWTPVERATLLFVRRNGKLLLIHKKRGLGAGKINGPGGRIDPGESPRQCAFTNGHSIHGFVFTATGIQGRLKETYEAKPIWVSEKDIPYQKMWADDRVWLPLMLAGKKFTGRFLFDDDTMLGCEMTDCIAGPRVV
jgi:8-oxo-dGTP diphosphatase